MEQSWEMWPLDMEMDDRDLLIEECQTDEEEFLREILSEQAFCSESQSQAFVQNNDENEIVMVGSNSNSNSNSNGPRTYILSFDNSTIIPATPAFDNSNSNSNSNSNMTRSSIFSSEKTKGTGTQGGGKRGGRGSQTVDHIMAERKRRQELTQKFIALSATIPGLKKTDKSSILGEAIDYVKQLQERVTKLEQRKKCANMNEDSILSETNSEDWCRPSEMLPDVEARVMENEVLIEIHCEKEDGVDLKILDQLENLHLCVTASSILPFGNSTLGITIIAQMGDAYRMTVNDLVKSLRQVLLNINADPY